jgi:hypothetical protein
VCSHNNLNIKAPGQTQPQAIDTSENHLRIVAGLGNSNRSMIEVLAGECAEQPKHFRAARDLR